MISCRKHPTHSKVYCSECRWEFEDEVKEKYESIIAEARKGLEKIANIEDCGCGIPCDCISGRLLVQYAKEALAKLEGK